jgi:hypothetical protein
MRRGPRICAVPACSSFPGAVLERRFETACSADLPTPIGQGQGPYFATFQYVQRTMTRLLLLDVGWPQAALLISHLRGVGFDIVRAVPGALDHAGIGKYCRQVSAPGDFNARYLSGLLADQPADVILPLTEEILAQVWQLPEAQIQNVFPATTSEQRLALMDRRTMYRFAVEEQVPIPPSRDLESTEDIAKSAESFGLPIVLRGTAGVGGKQVRILDTLTDADRELEDLRRASPGLPFAQKMIHGRRCLFGALLHEGRILSHFSQTTIESVNPPTGPSIRVQAIDNPRLHEYASRMFRRLGWSGLACAEFVAGDDGELYFMEINPRPWAAIIAAHECGIPLMQQFAEYLKTGNTTFPERPRQLKDVPLFPQFIFSKVLGASPFRMRDIPTALRCLASGPWSQPFLMLHYLRTLWWQR